MTGDENTSRTQTTNVRCGCVVAATASFPTPVGAWNPAAYRENAGTTTTPVGHEGRGNPTLGSVIPPTGLRVIVMATGKVDFFNDTGGYGFISTDDGDLDDDEDVFFHMEDVGGPDLEEGQEVEFDIESSPKGPRATNLVRN